jgi:hypothetical protein
MLCRSFCYVRKTQQESHYEHSWPLTVASAAAPVIVLDTRSKRDSLVCRWVIFLREMPFRLKYQVSICDAAGVSGSKSSSKDMQRNSLNNAGDHDRSLSDKVNQLLNSETGEQKGLSLIAAKGNKAAGVMYG